MFRLPESDLDDIAKRCAHLWPALHGKRLFITGAIGFIGRWMVESLLYAVEKTGYDMLRPQIELHEHNEFIHTAFPNYDKDVVTVNHTDLVIREGDETSYLSLIRPPEYVLHLAGGDFENPDETTDLIVNGCRNLLQELRMAGTCVRMLNVSSGVAETPTTVYGLSKRIAEKLCDASGVPTVHARIWACIGPGLQLDRKYAVGNFIADGLAGRPIVVKGSPSTIRSYIYASDLAVCLWYALLANVESGTLDFGSQDRVSIYEVATHISFKFGVPVHYSIPPEQHVVSSYVPTKWLPMLTAANLTHTWQSGLDKMIQWHKDQKGK